jgi:AI-2 transport protein TqsA
MSPLPLESAQLRVMLGICTAILLAAALNLASSVFAPLAFAIFILAVVWPLQEALDRRMPTGLALFVTLLVTIFVLLGFASMIAWSFSAIADWILNNLQRFQSLYSQFSEWLEGQGIAVATQFTEHFDVAWLARMLQGLAAQLNRFTGFAVLVFIFLMMALLEVHNFERRLSSLGGERTAKLIVAASTIGLKFRRYMLVRTLLSLLTGFVIWGFALLTGLEPAVAWGLLAFVLNYIPFLGPFIATLLPGLFALAQLDSWQMIVFVILGLVAIQFLIGNYLEPLVAGATLSVSPLVVVFAVVFWGYLWGIPGAFIGVPIVLATIALCAQFPSSRWVAVLLADKPPGEARLGQDEAGGKEA